MILILGRFQPLHNGHMQVFRQALEDDPELVIAVGSAGRSNEPKNPFSGDERKEMIERALQANSMNAKVILIPNTDSDTHYVKHVEKHIGTRPDKVISENPWSIDLFRNAGYEVQVTHRHFELSSTGIRDKISKDQVWEDMVPTQVYQYIKEIDGVERIKGLLK